LAEAEWTVANWNFVEKQNNVFIEADQKEVTKL